MRLLKHNRIDKEDVRHMPEAELVRMGVRFLKRQEVVLQCASCMETWSPELDFSGKLPFDYWVCAAGCNRG